MATDRGGINPRVVLDAVVEFLLRLNSPVFYRELTVTFRKRKFFYTWTISMFVIAGGVATAAVLNFRETSNTIGLLISRVFIGLLALLVIVAAPSFTASSITAEREERTFALLEAAPMATWEIIYGKFISNFSYMIIFQIGALPFLVISFLYGGIVFADLLTAFGILFMISTLQIILSIAISASVKSTRSAQAVSVVVSIVIMILLLSWSETHDFLSGRPLAPLGGTLAKILCLGGALGGYAVLFTLFFVIALNRLSPSSHNKSTLARLWFLAASVFGLLAVCARIVVRAYSVASAVPGRSPARTILDGLAGVSYPDWNQHFFAALLVCVTLIVLAATFLATDRPRPSKRVGLWMRKYPLASSVFWIFMPGQLRGGVYVVFIALICLALTALPLWAVAFSSGAPAGTAFPAARAALLQISLCYLAFAFFGSQVARFFSTAARTKPWLARMLTCGLLALLSFLPLIWFDDFLSDGRQFFMLGASPFAAARARMYALFHGPADGTVYGRIMIFTAAAYILAGLAFFAGARTLPAARRSYDE